MVSSDPLPIFFLSAYFLTGSPEGEMGPDIQLSEHAVRDALVSQPFCLAHENSLFLAYAYFRSHFL